MEPGPEGDQFSPYLNDQSRNKGKMSVGTREVCSQRQKPREQHSQNVLVFRRKHDYGEGDEDKWMTDCKTAWPQNIITNTPTQACTHTNTHGHMCTCTQRLMCALTYAYMHAYSLECT